MQSSGKNQITTAALNGFCNFSALITNTLPAHYFCFYVIQVQSDLGSTKKLCFWRQTAQKRTSLPFLNCLPNIACDCPMMPMLQENDYHHLAKANHSNMKGGNEDGTTHPQSPSLFSPSSLQPSIPPQLQPKSPHGLVMQCWEVLHHPSRVSWRRTKTVFSTDWLLLTAFAHLAFVSYWLDEPPSYLKGF